MRIDRSALALPIASVPPPPYTQDTYMHAILGMQDAAADEIFDSSSTAATTPTPARIQAARKAPNPTSWPAENAAATASGVSSGQVAGFVLRGSVSVSSRWSRRRLV